MEKKTQGKALKNQMSKVFCPVAQALVWANSSKNGPRCTTCGQVHIGGK